MHARHLIVIDLNRGSRLNGPSTNSVTVLSVEGLAIDPHYEARRASKFLRVPGSLHTAPTVVTWGPVRGIL